MRLKDLTISRKILVTNLIEGVFLLAILGITTFVCLSRARRVDAQTLLTRSTNTLVALNRLLLSPTLDALSYTERQDKVKTLLAAVQGQLDTLSTLALSQVEQQSFEKLIASSTQLPPLASSFLSHMENYYEAYPEMQNELSGFTTVLLREGHGAEALPQALAQLPQVVCLLDSFFRDESDDLDHFQQGLDQLQACLRGDLLGRTSLAASLDHLKQTLTSTKDALLRFLTAREEMLVCLDSLENTIASIPALQREVMAGENQRAVVIFLLVLVVFATVKVLLDRQLTRDVAHPMVAVTRELEGLRNGNLSENQRVATYVDRQDEVGRVVRALREHREKLVELVSQCQQVASNLQTANTQLGQSSAAIAQGASSQASSAEEASSALEEITASVTQSADNAKESEVITRKAIESLDHLGQSGMATSNKVNAIGEKIGVMNEIANQTNILALNAAVEAARAGEQGRGFAVVASEVRKLAEESQKAADEVVTLVRGMITDSQGAVKALQELTPRMGEVNRYTQEVAEASGQQRNGIEQISIAVQQLSEVAQANAASSEQLAANAQEINDQGRHLIEILSYFKK